MKDKMPRANKIKDITKAYTDGSSLGNPGKAGWAFVVDNGHWGCGHDRKATNQRMELTAAYMAVKSIECPLLVVSDSRYVVDCFQKEWWKGWHKRNWVNIKKQPIANRDIWEPFIEEVRSRKDIEFKWIKGHSGNQFNDAADQLAVAAANSQISASGIQYPNDVDPKLI